MKDKWNARYASEEYVYGIEPNVYFKEKLGSLHPGKILLPAEGEGRNALFALQKGWEVKAFDFSEEARKKAEKLIGAHGYTIDYQADSWQNFSCRYCDNDVVGIFFFHLPESQRRYFHQVVYDWLRPGGYLIAEFFSIKQLGLSSGGPQDPDLLYTADSLSKEFVNFRLEECEEKKVVLNEGIGHQGEAWVVRVFGRKL